MFDRASGRSLFYSWSAASPAYRGHTNEATIAARQRFFGAENVDARTGEVRQDRVIFSWITNAGYAASFRGRIVLLDTYINRLEVAPTAGPDLRRTSFGPQDLIDLKPEAILLGHGHGDHADNAAFIAKWLDIPVYATPETCDVLQEDVARMAADPNTVNGGAKLVPDAKPVNCIDVVPRGSVPGTSVANIKQLNPVACIVAFKHIHSSSVPTDPKFWEGNPIVPVVNDYDPREQSIYPPAREGRALFRLSDFSQWQEGVVFATADAINAKRDLLQRFIQAYQHGTSDYQLNFFNYDDGGDFIPGPEYTRYLDFIAQQNHVTPQALAAAKTYCDRRANLDVADMEHQVLFWKERGQLSDAIKPADLWDVYFIGEERGGASGAMATARPIKINAP